MVSLAPREQEVRDLLWGTNPQSRDTTAEWLGIKRGTVNTLAFRIRTKYRKAGESLPDNRRHFVTH